MNPVFSYIPFRTESVHRYKKDFKEDLGRRFKNYSIRMESMGQEISDLIPNFYRNGIVEADTNRLNKNHEVTQALVRRVNTGNDTKLGLENKHIALWHSHGWYYENTLDRWEWQRARVYTTVEDLWTMEFVVPYIAPMLEKAGANVLFPRERDVQKNEVIVDADWSSEGSEYLADDSVWELNSQAGFANKYPFYIEGENPFEHVGVSFSNCGKIATLWEDVKGEWVEYKGINGSASFAVDVPKEYRDNAYDFSDFYNTFDWVDDDGVNNMNDWFVE